MYYIVYKTTNLVNNKEYIGIHQTKDLKDGYLGSGKHLKRAVTKYGKENFNREVLFSYDNEQDMLTKEAELVTEEWCSWSNTYNICVGGFGGGWKYCNSTGKNLIAEEKKPEIYRRVVEKRNSRKHPKYVEAAKRRYMIDGPQRLNPQAFKGRKHSEETKRLIGGKSSVRQSGEKNSQFGSMWITNGTENRKTKMIDSIPEGWYKGRSVL